MASHFKDGTLPGARWQFYLQFLIHSIFVRVFLVCLSSFSDRHARTSSQNLFFYTGSQMRSVIRISALQRGHFNGLIGFYDALWYNC